MNIKVNTIKRIALVILGGVVTAAGLQLFLLPNHMLDGGITGISIISAELTGLPIGLFLVLLNTPFVFFGYKKFGQEFALYSVIGIVTLALLTLVHIPNGFTDVPILAAIFGGMIVGIGVGIAVRYGGIIDGADTIAILIDRKTVFSVSEAIMAINAVIIMVAGLVFGWEQALYSLIAYFVAHKAIEVTIEGLDESRCVWVVSMEIRAIGKAINELLQEPVTYVKEANPNDAEPHGVMLVVITRLEEQKVKKAIRAVDSKSYIVMTDAHEIVGKVPENSLNRDV